MPSSVNFAQHLPTTLVTVGIVLLTMMMLLNVRRRLTRRLAEPARDVLDIRPTPRPDRHRIAPPNPAADRTAESLARLHDALEELSGQLDTRVAVLEALIRQADERLRLLSDVLDHAPGASISPTKNRATRPRQAEDLIDDGADLPFKPASSPRQQRSGAAARLEVNAANLDPLCASVYELADRGRSPVEIAQYLNEQVGKVELILALRQAS